MEVIPVTPEAQFHPVSKIRTRTFFIIYEQLDEGLLKNGLDRLIREFWRKLGARLIARPRDGCLEYHLPATFDDDYELFKWSAAYVDSLTEEALPLARTTLPENGVSLLPSMDTVDAVCRPSSWPFERKDEPPNAPLLYVHLTFFIDGTSIAISCPHTTADQQGLANIIKAWLLVIDGGTPSAMIGSSENILPRGKLYSQFPRSQVVRKGKIHVRRPFERLLVVLGFLPELVLRPHELSYTLFIPLPVLESLRGRLTKELIEKYGAVQALSYGDIVTAIALKLSRLGHKRPKTITFSQTVNMRNRVPSLLGENAKGYVHNALIWSSARLSVDQSIPLSHIAHLNRKSLSETLQQDNIELELAIIREMVRRRQTMHNCEIFEQSYSISNWGSAWKDLNFSVARRRSEKEVCNTRPQFVVFGGSELKHTPKRFAALITFRNEAGFWCEFSVSSRTAEKVKEYLAKDPTLQEL